MIKLGNQEITLKVGSNDVSAAYLGSTLVYSGGTPPTPSYKWLATYTGGTTSSAECDASSAITSGEINITDLVSVEIGDCVTSIGVSAFEYCISLTSVTIPNSVTSIGNRAFSDCESLISITCFAETPPTLNGYPFNDTNNCPIYVPAASVSAYQSAWSRYASRIQAIP